MARQRNYAAEYARRNRQARAAGWQSYWHERQTRKAAQDYEGASRRAFIATAKDPPPGVSPARVRSLWAEGSEAMHNGDVERARQIAIELDYEPDNEQYPPESAFWYH